MKKQTLTHGEGESSLSASAACLIPGRPGGRCLYPGLLILLFPGSFSHLKEGSMAASAPGPATSIVLPHSHPVDWLLSSAYILALVTPTQGQDKGAPLPASSSGGHCFTLSGQLLWRATRTPDSYSPAMPHNLQAPAALTELFSLQPSLKVTFTGLHGVP